MYPILTIVGRPNVGKSTLFNRLTKTNAALVADQPGVTRDRQYGMITYEERMAMVVDTGGLADDREGVHALMADQVQQAITEASALLFVVDGRDGLCETDREIALQLRQQQKPLYLVVNKVDGLDLNMVLAEFYELGFDNIFPVSASHGRGVVHLLDAIWPTLPEHIAEPEEDLGIKIALIGRPNAGKSTLLNRIIGEERAVVFDEPGTTRDSLFVPFERHGQRYTLIDTAGMRRRSKIDDKVEKDSTMKTLQAISRAHVAVMVFDAQREISEQDLRLMGLVMQVGKALVIAINKWDGLDSHQREVIKSDLDRRLDFVDFAKVHFISAKHGTGVGEIFDSVKRAYISATTPLVTSQLTRILEDAILAHQPPLVKGRRIRLRYAHPGGLNPPCIVIHGKQIKSLPPSYKRYLSNCYRKALKLEGTPVKIELRNTENPYVQEKS